MPRVTSRVLLHESHVLTGRPPGTGPQWEFELPEPRLLVAQILVSGADWMPAASVLYHDERESQIEPCDTIAGDRAAALEIVPSKINGGTRDESEAND